MLRRVIARGVMVVFAVCAAVLLAGSLGSTTDLESGVRHVAEAQGSPASGPRAERAWTAYAHARRFGADADVLAREAGGRAILGDFATARRLAVRATRIEPENFQAWFVLYRASAPGSPLARRARMRILALDPQAGPALGRPLAPRGS